MEAQALLLLEKDEIAQRLVIAWPKVRTPKISAGKKAKRPDFDELTEWAEAASVVIEDVVDRVDLLFVNEICYADGSTDALANKFIHREVLRRAGMIARHDKPTKDQDGKPSKGKQEAPQT